MSECPWVDCVLLVALPGWLEAKRVQPWSVLVCAWLRSTLVGQRGVQGAWTHGVSVHWAVGHCGGVVRGPRGVDLVYPSMSQARRHQEPKGYGPREYTCEFCQEVHRYGAWEPMGYRLGDCWCALGWE